MVAGRYKDLPNQASQCHQDRDTQESIEVHPDQCRTIPSPGVLVAVPSVSVKQAKCRVLFYDLILVFY